MTSESQENKTNIPPFFPPSLLPQAAPFASRNRKGMEHGSLVEDLIYGARVKEGWGIVGA
jgi:hypothetical protein